MKNVRLIIAIILGAYSFMNGQEIVHDAEYYILEAQNGEKWMVEDDEIDKKLDELKKKYKTSPNIIHFMWDDQPVGAVSIPALQKMKGYETPEAMKKLPIELLDYINHLDDLPFDNEGEPDIGQ